MNDSILHIADTLGQIANVSVARNTNELNSIMPWIVALFIGIFTIIANIIINKNQRELTRISLKNQLDISVNSINKDILSKNRQEWINTLRDCVSDYLSSHELSKLIVKHDKKGTDTPPEYRTEFKTWQSLTYKIQMLLNPNEEKSKKLFDLMRNLNLATDYYSNAKENEYESIKNKIIETTQLILKEEWERVKRIE
jgi:hypothetical protein